MASPIRRCALLSVVVLLLSIGVVLGPSASPAAACSCMPTTDADAFARSDAVFVGEVIDYEPPPPAEVMSSGDPATWTFGVSEVYKGEVTTVQQIVSAVSGATCGLEIPHQGEFIVFATAAGGIERTGDGQYQSGLCDGTRSTADGPLGVDADPSSPIAVPDPVEEIGPPSDDDGRAWLPWAAVGVAAMAGAMLLGVRRARAAKVGQPSGP
jgi:hypothetical protein